MVTKLFKIGESSYYGKWRVTVDNRNHIITLDGIDYNSDKVMETTHYTFMEMRAFRDYTEQVSTSYYSGQMVQWVENKANLDYWRK